MKKVLIFAIVIVINLTNYALATNVVDDKVTKSVEYILNTVENPQVGTMGGEWAVLGLARSTKEIPNEYFEKYYNNVLEYVKSTNGILHDKKYTEYSRVAAALTAIGKDPRNVGGYNLLKPLADFEKTVWQGINGPIWALIALDSKNYDIPDNSEAKTKATRQMYIDEILSRQLESGGFNLTDKGGNNKADVDITAMSLQALAKYKDQPKVKEAINKAIVCLSNMQGEDGGFSAWGETNCESTVQVIVALCTLGIDTNDSRFVKSGKTVLDGLFEFYNHDGSFNHSLSDVSSNIMASEQGLYGLSAVKRFNDGKKDLYDMSDVSVYEFGLGGKHEDVAKTNISNKDAKFNDIQNHKNEQAILALAQRGIINGRQSELFVPDETMTRAEFCKIIVESLGLPLKNNTIFSDVLGDKWYFAYVSTAYEYGIVNGVGENKFNPNGNITRQEAAVMVMRASALCGLYTDIDTSITYKFSDSLQVSSWAVEAISYCYNLNILEQSDDLIEPKRDILRSEISQMVYNMLSYANLL